MKETVKQFAIKYRIPLIILGLLLLAGIIWLMNRKSDGSETAKLARCLKKNGAKFYGASWCPHCNSQKAMFGSSARLLPYVECSNADRSQKKECTDVGVKGYPMWIFADGNKVSGEIPLEQLKRYAGC